MIKMFHQHMMISIVFFLLYFQDVPTRKVSVPCVGRKLSRQKITGNHQLDLEDSQLWMDFLKTKMKGG